MASTTENSNTDGSGPESSDDAPSFEDFSDQGKAGQDAPGSSSLLDSVDLNGLTSVIQDPALKAKVDQAISVAKPVVSKVGARNLVTGVGVALILGSLLLPNDKE